MIRRLNIRNGRFATSLVLFSILFHCISYSQTDLSNNINFISGISGMQAGNEKYTIHDFQSEYPETFISELDFSGYEFDPFSSHEVFALVPTLIALEFGVPLKKSERPFFERSEHRLKIWFESTLFYNDNREKIVPVGFSSGGNEIIYRNFYDVSMDAASFGFTYAVHHKSNYKGKQERTRLWFGLGIMNAVSVLTGTVLQVEGTFEITGPFPAPHDAFYYPQTDITFYKKYNYYKLGTRYLTGFEIPLGVEWKFGNKERFHSGIQVSFGNAFLLAGGYETISAFYLGGGVTFRFQLRK